MSALARPHALSFLLAALCAAMANAQASPAYGVEVCTVTGTSGEYSVRVRNAGSAPLARAEIAGVRLDAAGQAGEPLAATLRDIPPGKYKTAVLGRHGDSVALVSIATYVSAQGAETRQEDLYAGKVAHVSPGSALPYTLAPLATPPVARLLLRTTLPFSASTLTMRVPAWMPVPSTSMPTVRPEVLLTLRVKLPASAAELAVWVAARLVQLVALLLVS